MPFSLFRFAGNVGWDEGSEAQRRRALDALLEPLICIANIGVGSWLYPARRNVRVRWEPDASALIALLKARSRPIICFAWHKYELLATCAVKPSTENRSTEGAQRGMCAGRPWRRSSGAPGPGK